MPDDIYGMRLALAEAERAYALGEVPIGAVILDETGSVIASGYNLRENRHDATAHAELLAIQRACQRLGRWRLTGMTLYVTIEPCPMCAGAAVNAHLSSIIYGAPNPWYGSTSTLFTLLSVRIKSRVFIRYSSLSVIPGVSTWRIQIGFLISSR